MIPALDTFLSLPAAQAAEIIRAQGPQVCVFPINGTRRWFLLEHAAGASGPDPLSAYLKIAGQAHIDIYRLIFQHGVDTLLTPVFGPDIMARGDFYMDGIAARGLADLAQNPDFLHYYDEQQVRVRFYGDYRRKLSGTRYGYLCDLFDEVTRRTQDYRASRLFFGVFANDPSENIAEISVSFFQQHGRAPNRRELVERYYGEWVDPVSFFIGFDKLSAFDMPLLATGAEDLYFTASPSLYLTEEQLRRILYDHLFMRSAPEPDYGEMEPADLAYMSAFYTTNRDRLLGLGELRGGVWYPRADISNPIETGERHP